MCSGTVECQLLQQALHMLGDLQLPSLQALDRDRKAASQQLQNRQTDAYGNPLAYDATRAFSEPRKSPLRMGRSAYKNAIRQVERAKARIAWRLHELKMAACHHTTALTAGTSVQHDCASCSNTAAPQDAGVTAVAGASTSAGATVTTRAAARQVLGGTVITDVHGTGDGPTSLSARRDGKSPRKMTDNIATSGSTRKKAYLDVYLAALQANGLQASVLNAAKGVKNSLAALQASGVPDDELTACTSVPLNTWKHALAACRNEMSDYPADLMQQWFAELPTAHKAALEAFSLPVEMHQLQSSDVDPEAVVKQLLILPDTSTLEQHLSAADIALNEYINRFFTADGWQHIRRAAANVQGMDAKYKRLKTEFHVSMTSVLQRLQVTR